MNHSLRNPWALQAASLPPKPKKAGRGLKRAVSLSLAILCATIHRDESNAEKVVRDLLPSLEEI
jgi:hypothetical protein